MDAHVTHVSRIISSYVIENQQQIKFFNKLFYSFLFYFAFYTYFTSKLLVKNH